MVLWKVAADGFLYFCNRAQTQKRVQEHKMGRILKFWKRIKGEKIIFYIIFVNLLLFLRVFYHFGSKCAQTRRYLQGNWTNTAYIQRFLSIFLPYTYIKNALDAYSCLFTLFRRMHILKFAFVVPNCTQTKGHTQTKGPWPNTKKVYWKVKWISDSIFLIHWFLPYLVLFSHFKSPIGAA